MNMKRVYIKPVTEELFCDNELILCVSNPSGTSQVIGGEDPSSDEPITTDPGKNPFDD